MLRSTRRFCVDRLWAKLDRPRSVYSDLTWTGFVGSTVPEPYEKVFQIVARARDAAINRVRTAFARGETLQGWQVDEAARAVIEQPAMVRLSAIGRAIPSARRRMATEPTWTISKRTTSGVCCRAPVSRWSRDLPTGVWRPQ